MLSGPAGGIWRPKRLFTKPMSICFGVQGASEMILGAKNMFSGCLNPVPHALQVGGYLVSDKNVTKTDEIKIHVRKRPR